MKLFHPSHSPWKSPPNGDSTHFHRRTATGFTLTFLSGAHRDISIGRQQPLFNAPLSMIVRPWDRAHSIASLSQLTVPGSGTESKTTATWSRIDRLAVHP